MTHWGLRTVQTFYGNNIWNIVLKIRVILAIQGCVVASFFKLILCPLQRFGKGTIYTSMGEMLGVLRRVVIEALTIPFSSGFLD